MYSLYLHIKVSGFSVSLVHHMQVFAQVGQSSGTHTPTRNKHEVMEQYAHITPFSFLHFISFLFFFLVLITKPNVLQW